MDKPKYQNLSEKDYAKVGYHIMDYPKELGLGDSMANEAALSTMAIVLKETRDRKGMIDYLSEHIGDETTLTYLRKLERENYTCIEELSKKFDVETLQASVLFSGPKHFTEAEMYSTPKGISELAITLLNINESDTILDLGSGASSFLTQAAYASGSKNLYGVEINTNAVIIANLRKFITRLPIRIIQGNIISQEYLNLSANKVFSNYPLGMKLPGLQNYLSQNPRLKKYFKEAKRTVSGDWVFGMGAYLNTSMPGKTVVLMTNAGTWNKPDEELRRELVDGEIVEGVILLPERLLATTMIPLTMLVLGQNNKKIRMVDASEIYTEGRRQNFLEQGDVNKIVEAYYNDTNISKSVEKVDIMEQEYILNPQRYIGFDIVNGIPFGEICKSINRGAMIRSSELDTLVTDRDTNYYYLMLQNIQDGAIDSKLPGLINIEDRLKRYCIKDRNLIISKIYPFKVAMARVREDEDILANGNLYFIELDETKVNPIFIEAFLQSELGMAQLNRFAKGSAMKSISIQDLRMVKVPNIPRKKQDLIAEKYENFSDELIVLQKQIDIVRDRKVRLLEAEGVI